MRINEDYIDSIEVDDISAEVEATDDNFNDKDMYRFAFFFRTREVDITYVTEDGWKSIADEFYRTLYGLLDASPIIKEYKHVFPLYVGCSYFLTATNREPAKIMEFSQGREIRFYDYNHPTRGRQPFSFMLQLDADIRTLERLRILIIFLWRTFQMLSLKTFIPEPKSIEFVPVGRGYDDVPTINPNNYQIWLRKSSDDLSRKRYRSFMKAIHPEITGKQINDMIYDFLKDTGDSRLAEIVNQIHKESGGITHRIIDKALQNVRLEGDTLVITKDKFTCCCYNDFQKLLKTKVKFRVEGLSKIEYGIGVYGVNESLASIHDIFVKVEKFFPGDWTLEISVTDTSFFG